MPTSENHVKKLNSKDVDILEQTTNLHSHAGRAKSRKAAVMEATTTRATQEHSSQGREEARDPGPDVEVRQDLLSILGDVSNIGIMLLLVPKHVFSDISEPH